MLFIVTMIEFEEVHLVRVVASQVPSTALWLTIRRPSVQAVLLAGITDKFHSTAPEDGFSPYIQSTGHAELVEGKWISPRVKEVM
jgi:hypothetical protein